MVSSNNNNFILCLLSSIPAGKGAFLLLSVSEQVLAIAQCSTAQPLMSLFVQ